MRGALSWEGWNPSAEEASLVGSNVPRSVQAYDGSQPFTRRQRGQVMPDRRKRKARRSVDGESQASNGRNPCKADNDAGTSGLETIPDQPGDTLWRPNPRSASRVEQTCKSLWASFLSRGCENLGTESVGSGIPFCTPGDDGAERGET